MYEGTTQAKTLNPLGTGYYEGAAGPGEVGNFSLAGHRTTLTSCHRMFSRAQRYVMHGELDHWMPKSNGVPPEVAP